MKIPYLMFFLLLSTMINAQNEKKSVYDFPIPQTIEKCFKLLDKTMSDNEIQLIKALQEDSIYYHKEFKYGTDFFHAWKIYDGSKLTKYFNKNGLYGSHEIYNTILVSYHRYLNNQEVKLAEQINKYKIIQENEKKEYQQKLLKDTINGIYIPKDLEDCFIQLDKLLSDEDKQTIKQLKDRNETILYHHGLGTWLRNNWGLWGGSRLQVYFQNKNVSHPDNMSGLILVGYNKYLNGNTVDADSLIQEEKLRQEEFMKSVNVLPTIKFADTKKFYSKEYKRFLRTKRIDNFDVYDW